MIPAALLGVALVVFSLVSSGTGAVNGIYTAVENVEKIAHPAPPAPPAPVKKKKHHKNHKQDDRHDFAEHDVPAVQEYVTPLPPPLPTVPVAGFTTGAEQCSPFCGHAETTTTPETTPTETKVSEIEADWLSELLRYGPLAVMIGVIGALMWRALKPKHEETN